MASSSEKSFEQGISEILDEDVEHDQFSSEYVMEELSDS